MIFISSSFRSREERRGLVLKLKPGEAREARWMMRMAFSESAPKMEDKGGKKKHIPKWVAYDCFNHMKHSK